MKKTVGTAKVFQTRFFLKILYGMLAFLLISAGSLVIATPSNVQAAAGPFAYITNYLGNTVSVIDLSNNSLVKTIGVGEGPVGIAITPDGTRVYVTNTGSGIDTGHGVYYTGNTVSVIDTSTNTVIQTITLGSPGCGPYGIAMNPAGTRVYVTNLGNTSSTSYVSVIDTATNGIITTIPVGSFPYGVVVSPDGLFVCVSNSHGNTLSVIDPLTNTVSRTLSESGLPVGVGLNASGTRLYVGHYYTDSVTVYDTNNWSVAGSISGVNLALTFTLNPAGTQMWVANHVTGGSVSVINTANNTLFTIIPVGNNPVGINFSHDGSKAYVCMSRDNRVAVIDTTNYSVNYFTYSGASWPYSWGQFIVPAPVAPPTNADTTTGVTSSHNPSTYGQSVTFTATVSPVPPATGTPTGTVDFKDGATTIAAGVALSGNTATFTTTSLSVGTHSITAVYNGDGSFNGSTGTLSGGQTVNKALATVTLSNLSQTYDGTPKSVTVTTVPPGLSVLVTYNGSPTPPTNLGSYAVIATVTDPNYAGSASGTLNIIITYDSLGNLVRQFVTKQGIANSLLAKLENAKKAEEKGNANAKAGMIDAFINEVEAQTGKAISPENAAILISLARAL